MPAYVEDWELPLLVCHPEYPAFLQPTAVEGTAGKYQVYVEQVLHLRIPKGKIDLQYQIQN